MGIRILSRSKKFLLSWKLLVESIIVALANELIYKNTKVGEWLFSTFTKNETSANFGIASMRNRFSGEKCIIVGNGPSVRLEDLNLISHSGIPVFCCNKFYLSYKDHDLRPNFTLACDKQVIEDFGQDIITKSSGVVILGCEGNYNCIEGDYVKAFLKEYSFSGKPLFCKTPIFGLPTMSSVVIMGLQIAYYMGFKEAYLYGIDHQFNVVLDPNKADPWRSASNDDNHFIKNYRQGSGWAPPETDAIEEGFLACKRAFEKSNRNIINLSRKSNLPYIERNDFQDFFSNVL